MFCRTAGRLYVEELCVVYILCTVTVSDKLQQVHGFETGKVYRSQTAKRCISIRQHRREDTWTSAEMWFNEICKT
jgi:hypothetical protein